MQGFTRSQNRSKACKTRMRIARIEKSDAVQELLYNFDHMNAAEIT